MACYVSWQWYCAVLMVHSLLFKPKRHMKQSNNSKTPGCASKTHTKTYHYSWSLLYSTQVKSTENTLRFLLWENFKFFQRNKCTETRFVCRMFLDEDHGPEFFTSRSSFCALSLWKWMKIAPNFAHSNSWSGCFFYNYNIQSWKFCFKIVIFSTWNGLFATKTTIEIECRMLLQSYQN